MIMLLYKKLYIRRYKNKTDLPDLIVIDGGKGQLSAAYPRIT